MPQALPKFMEDYNMTRSFVPYILFASLLIAGCGEKNLPPGGSGLIESTEIIISSQVPGQLKALYFEEGGRIKVGDTIGIIDTLTTILQLREAEAMKQVARTKLEAASITREQASYNYELAKKEFDRIASLLKSATANQQQYDQVENALNQASLGRKQADAALNAARADITRIEAAIDLLRKLLGDCYPTSPTSGRVADKFVDIGELVSLGAPILKIAKLDTVWVKVYLPATDLTRIKLGGRAEVDPEDGRGDKMNGYVSWISSQAEFTPKNVQTKESRANLVYAVKIIIPNPDERLKIGMPVSVIVP